MKARFLEDEFRYDGSQLISLWNYLQHNLLGDSVVSWIGPCHVGPEHMVDGEDLLQNATISGDRMLHFIVEKFDSTMLAAVALQRLFTTITLENLRVLIKDQTKAQALTRKGDDIFLEDRKLSISIATQSPMSSLIHFAVNINNGGTPVATVSLEDLGVEPKILALRVLPSFCTELDSIVEATHKVKWVK